MKINIKEIIDNIPKDVKSNEEILRYIYLELGNRFSYNRDYFYVLNPTSSKDIYDEWVQFTEDKDEEKVKTVCKQIIESFVKAVNSILYKVKKENIEARILGFRYDEENHVAALVKSGDKKYYMDLYRDIYRIQKGMRTKYFTPDEEVLQRQLKGHPEIKEDLGEIKCDKIDEKTIEEMDKKFGYSLNGIYMDDAIEMLKREMENEENWKKYIEDYDDLTKKENKEDIIARLKIDFMFKYFNNNVNEKIGIYEICKFYDRLYDSLLTESEKKKNVLKRYDIKKNNDKRQREESVIYEIKRDNGNLYYIYEGDKGRFKEETQEKLKEDENEGNLQYLSDYVRPDFDDDEFSR